jgi:hypothetical protein
MSDNLYLQRSHFCVLSILVMDISCIYKNTHFILCVSESVCERALTFLCDTDGATPHAHPQSISTHINQVLSLRCRHYWKKKHSRKFQARFKESLKTYTNTHTCTQKLVLTHTHTQTKTGA